MVGEKGTMAARLDPLNLLCSSSETFSFSFTRKCLFLHLDTYVARYGSDPIYGFPRNSFSGLGVYRLTGVKTGRCVDGQV